MDGRADGQTTNNSAIEKHHCLSAGGAKKSVSDACTHRRSVLPGTYRRTPSNKNIDLLDVMNKKSINMINQAGFYPAQ